jgi:hypothetical protein
MTRIHANLAIIHVLVLSVPDRDGMLVLTVLKVLTISQAKDAVSVKMDIPIIHLLNSVSNQLHVKVIDMLVMVENAIAVIRVVTDVPDQLQLTALNVALDFFQSLRILN